MRAEVTKAFKWHGEIPEGVEVKVGEIVEGSCAENAISMGCAVPVPAVVVEPKRKAKS